MRLALLVLCACGSSSDPAPQAKPAPPPPRDAGPVPERIRAIGDISYLEPAMRRAFEPAGDFEPLGESDWMRAHPEAAQSYDDFMRATTHVPDDTRKVLYLLPIGEFPATAPPIPAIAQVVHAFYTLDVQTLPGVKLADLKVTTRINSGTQRRQLLAPEVLQWLTTRVPDDAFAVVAITMEDLYPDPKWNFVFGQASFDARVAVESFARQDPEFFGEKRDAGTAKLALRRALWTMVHEIAHTFGLHHCQYWSCVVAGSNSQRESDSRPLHLCPVCARKLQNAIGWDPAARELGMAKVLRDLGIDDEAAWSEHRAAWIRDGKR